MPLGDWLLYAALLLSTWVAWRVSRSGLYNAGSDLGYWLGVAGGVAMLALFAYPLRKRWRVLARFGKAKYWFVLHMALGLLGPLLVLAHATFRVGSLNAGVALFSMLLVSASGVVGRFLYLRIHAGLGGERLNLDALRVHLAAASGGTSGASHALAPVPEVARRLAEFEARCTVGSGQWLGHWRLVVALPWRAALVRHGCVRALRRGLRAQAAAAGWTRAERRQRQRTGQSVVDEVLRSVLRVAQFTAFARLFSLWHVLHVPFVYLMVACAVVHVVAVHAY